MSIKIESFLDKIAKLQNWEEVMNQCKQLFQFEFESKPLNKCFHLRMASKQVYDWLNEYSVRIDGSYQKLFDLLLESASTDIIMSILQRYEIRYWNTKKYYEEKTSSLRSYLIWLNNGDVGQTAALIKDIPREYYCLGENGNNNIYLYSSCILPRPAATEALSQRPPGPDSAAT